MRTRAERRAQKERIKAWAKRQAKNAMRASHFHRAHAEATIRGWLFRAEHPQSCSCRGCGNARQYEGPTLQERRAMLTGFED